jgi:Beta-ketoacyl synthase, N-terminal domain
MKLSAFIDGVGVLGPGLANWPDTAAVLSGRRPYQPAATVLPPPAILAAAERRRAGRTVKVALSVAHEATQQAGLDPAQLASVFASSGGDGHNCHELCESLSRVNREVSPTRFANSVHNAAAGYWSIATGATAESNVLCAFDASFAAGLLEAVAQVAVDGVPVLLVSYDCDYPPPLLLKRPIPDAFGVALVLTPQRGAASLAKLDAALSDLQIDRFTDPGLEAMRSAFPAARALPLLRLLAARTGGSAVLEYLDTSRMEVRIEACN